jgi:hypothetical protein
MLDLTILECNEAEAERRDLSGLVLPEYRYGRRAKEPGANGGALMAVD